MTNYKDYAIEYLEADLNPVPIAEGGKNAVRKGHSQEKITHQEIDNFGWYNIGISCGFISGGVEALDFDLKNSNEPDEVMKSFKSNVSTELLEKLVAERTPSGGYHFVYKCDTIEGSRKLAMNETGEAIIETRGIGGYIKCFPSEGYEMLQGNFDNIPVITSSERLELLIACKMLSRDILAKAKGVIKSDGKYIEKFPEYNSDWNIGLDLLEEGGWTILKEDKEWFYLNRPDSKTQGIDGTYNKEGLFFYAWSTSSDPFESEKPYNNHAIYAELKCGGRYDITYAKLIERGLGSEKLTNTEWQESLDSLSFLSKKEEEEQYLEVAVADNIPLGLTTGWKSLDEYHRTKRNSFNIGLGYDGVGKSLFEIHKAVADFCVHGAKTLFVMPENKTAVNRRRLIEALSGKPISYFGDKPKLLSKYKKIAYENFFIIENQKHWTLSEVLDMSRKVVEVHGVDTVIIDPFNFFKGDSSDGYSSNNKILSEIRVFVENYCSVNLMAHPYSESTRSNMEDGYLKAPRSYHIEGGASFPYRTDDFYTLHRIKNHVDPDMVKTLQFIKYKVKEEETGGKVHPEGEYTKLIYETKNGFLGYWDDQGSNPMYDKFGEKEVDKPRPKQQFSEPMPRVEAKDAFDI